MSGRSIMKTIHLIRHVMEKYQKDQQDLHLIFIYLDETYDMCLGRFDGKLQRRKGL